jgi:hypothetical protein
MTRLFLIGLAVFTFIGVFLYVFNGMFPPAIARGGVTEFQKRIDTLVLTSASEDVFVARLAAYGLKRSDRPANHQAQYDCFMGTCFPYAGVDESTQSKALACL